MGFAIEKLFLNLRLNRTKSVQQHERPTASTLRILEARPHWDVLLSGYICLYAKKNKDGLELSVNLKNRNVR